MDVDEATEASQLGRDDAQAVLRRCDAQRWQHLAAVRLKMLEDENRRLKQLVAKKELDIQALRFIPEGNW